jgi:quercetin dioxygenase-like cupin family protein
MDSINELHKSKSHIIELIDGLPIIPVNHNSGKKRIIVSGESTTSNLTQVAFGYLEAGSIIESHSHKSMEEYFYFTKGTGFFIINGEEHVLSSNQLILVLPNASHSLVAHQDLEFLYWGIAI